MKITQSESFLVFGTSGKFPYIFSNWKRAMTIQQITDSILKLQRKGSLEVTVNLIESDSSEFSEHETVQSAIRFKVSGLDLIKVEIDSTNARFSKLFHIDQMHNFFDNLESYYQSPEEYGFVIGSCV